MNDDLIAVLTAATDVEGFAAWGEGVTDVGLALMRPRLMRFEDDDRDCDSEGGDEEWERDGGESVRGAKRSGELRDCILRDLGAQRLYF